MKFQIEKAKFLNALNLVSGAIPNKATIQVLNNFALRLEGNSLEVSATDLDLGIRIRVDVQGELDGAVVINARKLLDLVKSLIDPKIVNLSLEVVDYLVTIRWSERGKASITGFSIDDFPPFPEMENGTSFQLGKSELEFLAGKTLFATSNDPTRASLNGAYIEVKDNQLVMVATDGHRLGKAFIDVENCSLEHGVILPPKAVQYALKSISPEATLEIRVSDKNLLFTSEGVQVFSKLIEGPYPKYDAVIPSNFSRTVQVNRTDFINKISSVISMANSRTRMIRLQLDGNQMELSANDPNVGGDSTEAISVTHEGEGVYSIGFNGSYLSDVLKLAQSDDVILKMNGPVSACVIEPVGSDMNCMFLLMPLRLVED
ncbi:MAG: DNA polymerase III subunit beta [Hallerella porci]|uniref:Beta sliding clamp n=1 Tax=Hallerella porci TaxID=1945871 RepID=A0ABX5LN04_9BACT|nr:MULTISPECIES: DNA polymerase III subunit beta [Fibrobacteraceae]MCI5599982.1 DNA polymerase III subunit beta [Hallerella sp.]MDD7298214.1 DNA polymerase III subunit beta [Fibrobacter intestinalis]MDY3921933.1 DNA polymerase III subunit beta [Hallerella porci]PWK97292.1 DNA polymerase III beta subunit [Hallerella porci]